MEPLCALALAAVSLQLSSFATSIYLHRCLTHRALCLHPVIAFPMRLQLWLAAGIVAKEEAAVHRKHHCFADVEGDPHSPVLKGLWRIPLGNAYYYAREARNPETLAHYAPDVGNNWLDRHVFRYGLLGLGLGLLGFTFLLGAAVGRAGFCHPGRGLHLLQRRHQRRRPRRRLPQLRKHRHQHALVALVTAGEGLHNNHHAYPTSARFSLRRWELDRSWPLIRLLSLAPLARPLHLAPRA